VDLALSVRRLGRKTVLRRHPQQDRIHRCRGSGAANRGYSPIAL